MIFQIVVVSWHAFVSVIDYIDLSISLDGYIYSTLSEYNKQSAASQSETVVKQTYSQVHDRNALIFFSVAFVSFNVIYFIFCYKLVEKIDFIIYLT